MGAVLLPVIAVALVLIGGLAFIRPGAAITLGSLLTACFCGFGFLASFEVPGITWKLIYACLGMLSLTFATTPFFFAAFQKSRAQSQA
ncbi:MAG: hypothetical protein AAF483_01930 [Planctomycetota bacterium]